MGGSVGIGIARADRRGNVLSQQPQRYQAVSDPRPCSLLWLVLWR